MASNQPSEQRHRIILIVGAVVAVLVACAAQAWFLLPYIAVLMSAVGFLHTRPGYLAQPRHRIYDWVFLGYMLLIALNRTRPATGHSGFEFVVNIAEHVLFGCAICLLLRSYASLLWPVLGSVALVMLAVLAFNLIGIANELYQNTTTGRALWSLNADSLKDIAANAGGSMAFVLLALPWRSSPPPGRL
ncbi:MAG: hypothetical protein WAT74_13255 [Flavobacteriales bacterium]